jgi:DNA-binding XRE family transcriptional regulator
MRDTVDPVVVARARRLTTSGYAGRLRTRSRVSQRAIAERIGVRRHTYSTWETNRHVPQERFAPAIIRVFGELERELGIRPWDDPDLQDIITEAIRDALPPGTVHLGDARTRDALARRLADAVRSVR